MAAQALRTFADQAVIAIENLRMFDEVQTRTKELAHSITELRALGEVSQAVNSTIDLETVLSTIVAKAVQLSGTDGGAIYVFSAVRQKFQLRATYGMAKELIEAIGKQPMGAGESYIGRATQSGETLQVPDLREEPPTAMRDLVLHAGYRALLVVPLLRSDRIVGALVVRRRNLACSRLHRSNYFRRLLRSRCLPSRTRAYSATSKKRAASLN